MCLHICASGIYTRAYIHIGGFGVFGFGVEGLGFIIHQRASGLGFRALG